MRRPHPLVRVVLPPKLCNVLPRTNPDVWLLRDVRHKSLQSHEASRLTDESVVDGYCPVRQHCRKATYIILGAPSCPSSYNWSNSPCSSSRKSFEELTPAPPATKTGRQANHMETHIDDHLCRASTGSSTSPCPLLRRPRPGGRGSRKGCLMRRCLSSRVKGHRGLCGPDISADQR